MDTTLIRQADSSDASFLVPLFAESSGGVLPAIWKACAREEESIAASGERYLQDDTNNLSVKNTVIVESNTTRLSTDKQRSSLGRLGAMACYQEAPISEQELVSLNESAPADDLTKALAPYRALSDSNSLYIAEICFLPEARGLGLGTRLLDHATKLAITKNLPRVTLRVFSANSGAIRLYQRFGFEIADERPIIPHPEIKPKGLVYLMSYSI